MDLLQPLEQRPQDAIDVGRSELASTSQAAFERIARQQFHDDVSRAVDLEKVEDLHDARRAVQRRHGAAFGDKALPAPGKVFGDLGRARQYRRAVLAIGQRRRKVFLDRHLAIELKIARAVGDAEAALAQYGKDFVAPNLCALWQGRIIGILVGSGGGL